MRRPVFVRGVGACTPLGDSWPASAAVLATGATAIRPIDTFDATGFPCTVAAAMPRPEQDPEAATEDRRLLYARRAAREAWAMAVRSGAVPEAARVASPRIGVFIGAESGRGRFDTVLGLSRAARSASGTFDHERFGREARAFAARHAGFTRPGVFSARFHAAQHLGIRCSHRKPDLKGRNSLWERLARSSNRLGVLRIHHEPAK